MSAGELNRPTTAGVLGAIATLVQEFLKEIGRLGMGWLSRLFHLEHLSGLLNSDADTAASGADRWAEAAKRAAAESGSRDEAKNRLKLVLMHDRTQLSPDILQSMRDEMVEVISKYVEIDNKALELTLESESNTIALVANIPVLRSRAG